MDFDVLESLGGVLGVFPKLVDVLFEVFDFVMEGGLVSPFVFLGGHFHLNPTTKGAWAQKGETESRLLGFYHPRFGPCVSYPLAFCHQADQLNDIANYEHKGDDEKNVPDKRLP